MMVRVYDGTSAQSNRTWTLVKYFFLSLHTRSSSFPSLINNRTVANKIVMAAADLIPFCLLSGMSILPKFNINGQCPLITINHNITHCMFHFLDLDLLKKDNIQLISRRMYGPSLSLAPTPTPHSNPTPNPTHTTHCLQ